MAKDISDAALRKQLGGTWNQLSFSPRETTAAFRQKLGQADDDSSDVDVIPDDPDTKIDLSDAAGRLLHDAVDNPFKPLTDRYTLFTNDYKANQVKNELVDAGLVRERTLTIGTEHSKLLELTEQGKEYLADKEGVEIERRGKGGVVHRYWQHQIKDIFEQAGWTAKLELFDADVYVHMQEKEIAVEVAMGNNDREIDHVKQRLDRGLDEVWVVCPNDTIIAQLKEKLEEAGVSRERVAFKRLSDFTDPEIFKPSELAS